MVSKIIDFLVFNGIYLYFDKKIVIGLKLVNFTKLKSILVKPADDLGKPGTDLYYGKRFVNAFKAVK